MAGPDPLAAPALTPRKADLVTWSDWLTRHPDTTVVAQQPDLKKLYKRDPYHSYFGSDKLHFPVAPKPEQPDLRLKDRVVILTIDGENTVISLAGLEEAACLAVAAGTATALTPGVELCHREDVEKLLPLVKVERL